MRVICLLFEEKNSISEMAEACLFWTPEVAISDEAIFLEIGKCKKIYDEEVIIPQLRELMRCFGTHASMGIAGDVPTALAIARYKVKKKLLPIEAVKDYLLPFGGEDTTTRMVGALRRLGICTVGSFLQMPVGFWTSRFGKLGLLISQRMQDSSNMPWPNFSPKEKILEKFEVDQNHSVKSLEPLIFALKGLVDRIMTRLKGRQEAVTAMELLIAQESYSVVKKVNRTIKILFPLPQLSSSNALAILKERMEIELVKEPFETHIVLLQLEVLEKVPHQGSQSNFFNKKEEEKEVWASLVARLEEKIGKNSSFLASPVERYLPEKSWKKTLGEPASLAPPCPKRPLRLLAKPKKLKRMDKFLFFGKKTWKILSVDGPEHLKGEWWFDEFDREYYKIGTDLGEQLWVFRNLKSKEVFLHGFFD